MARFYGTVEGNRGQASRLGTESSGMNGHIRGWNVGGNVEMHARGEKDTCSLLLTGGSNGHHNSGVEIAAFEEEGPRVRFVVRLPGNLEARGYVGQSGCDLYDMTYSPEAPSGRLLGQFKGNGGDL